jgi:hypothetical protein
MHCSQWNKGEVARSQEVGQGLDLDRELALEQVDRLLAGADVRRDAPPGGETPDAQVRVGGAETWLPESETVDEFKQWVDSESVPSWLRDASPEQQLALHEPIMASIAARDVDAARIAVLNHHRVMLEHLQEARALHDARRV